MACRVIGRPAHDAEPIFSFNVTERDASVHNAAEWESMTLALARESRKLASGRPQAEIFLGMLDDIIPLRPDRPFLESVVSGAGCHGLGSDVYVVAASHFNARAFYPLKAGFQEWIDATLDRAVTDVLQLPYDPTIPSSFERLINGRSIEDSTVAEGRTEGFIDWSWKSSVQRRRFLRKMAPQKSPSRWRIYCDLERFSVSSLLGVGRDFDDPAAGSERVLVVFDDNRPEVQRGLIRGVEEDFPDCRYLVARLGASFSSNELLDLCQRQRSLWPRPLDFGGILELWHFYRRLQSPWLIWPSEPVEVEERRVCAEPIFSASPRPNGMEILFTSAWNTETAVQLIHASKDLGAMISRIPLTTRFRVDRAITPERLAIHVEWHSSERPLIWVHWGPGDGSGALLDVNGNPVKPQEWLGSFRRRNLPLPLALFVSDGSEEMARCFAEHGAGVALGFADSDLLQASHRFAIETFHAAVRHEGHRDAILTALRKESRTGPMSHPVIYASRP